MSPRTETTLRIVAPVAVGLLVLGAWQFLVSVVGVSDYLLPSPASIVEEFIAYWPSIASAMVITGTNALIGLVVGSILGMLLAALAARWRGIDQMSAPVVASLAVIPIVALAPVLNSMFGADSQFGRQAIAALASFVPVFINTLRGFRQTAPVHRDLMKAYAANSGQVLAYPHAAHRAPVHPHRHPHRLIARRHLGARRRVLRRPARRPRGTHLHVGGVERVCARVGLRRGIHRPRAPLLPRDARPRTAAATPHPAGATKPLTQNLRGDAPRRKPAPPHHRTHQDRTHGKHERD